MSISTPALSLQTAFSFVNSGLSANVIELIAVHEQATQCLARFRVLDDDAWSPLLEYILKNRQLKVRGTLLVGIDYQYIEGRLRYAWLLTMVNEISLEDTISDVIQLICSFVDPTTAKEPELEIKPVAETADVSSTVDEIADRLRRLLTPESSTPIALAEAREKEPVKSKPHTMSQAELVNRLGSELPEGGLRFAVELGISKEVSGAAVQPAHFGASRKR